MPLRVVGMLFGIPEHFQNVVLDQADNIRTERGEKLDHSEGMTDGQVFAEFIDWRMDNPSDDLTSELLEVEFEDETGTRRRLHRDELLMFMNVVSVAGAETTTRLIGWSGKLLSDHPDQRRQLAADRSLLPGRHRRDPEIRAAGAAGRALCHPRYRSTTGRPFPRAARC